jgi:pyruvate dehydrogenase complex dehydrogenase (E1) component
MNRFACIFVAFGLAAAGSTALAAEPQPVMMSDAQMDNVTGGGLIDVMIQDNLNHLSFVINATVTALVNANVLVNAPVNVNVNVLTGLGL